MPGHFDRLPAMSVHSPAISVVVPVHNESGNVVALLDEIAAALTGVAPFEAVFVDDRSSDDTARVLQDYAQAHAWLTVVQHRNNCGQSTAVRTGVRCARAPVVATLDGDGQNHPADIPALLARWRVLQQSAGNAPVLIAGWRAKRLDTPLRRFSSRVANGVRSRLLGDATPDSGCGLKLFAREDFLDLPYFDHMHRFLPALFRRAGGTVESVPVRHRNRAHGKSHYGVGNRLWVGLVDILGVMWLQRRARVAQVVLPGPRP
jgi:dolichol-phosphate mannosyltransferase